MYNHSIDFPFENIVLRFYVYILRKNGAFIHVYIHKPKDYYCSLTSWLSQFLTFDIFFFISFLVTFPPQNDKEYKIIKTIRGLQNPDRIGLISLGEAAHLLNIANSTLQKWRRNKRLPAKCVVKVSDGKHMYIETEIIKVIAQGDIYDTSLLR